MPPALSDYESGSETCTSPTSFAIDQHLESMRGQPIEVESQEPKAASSNKLKRPRKSKQPKRSQLLQGLDMNNIIPDPSEVEEQSHTDENRASSIPVSSYRVQRAAKKVQSSQRAYDQEYHPMDDYLWSSQSEFDGDGESAYPENASNDSDSDTNDQPGNKRMRIYWCRSDSDTNNDLPYSTSVHPTDTQLEELEKDTADQDASDNNEPNSEVVVATIRFEERVIAGPEDELSDLNATSTPQRTPVSFNIMEDHALAASSPDPDSERSTIQEDQLEQTPFEIYSDPPGPYPPHIVGYHYHDNKENRVNFLSDSPEVARRASVVALSDDDMYDDDLLDLVLSPPNKSTSRPTQAVAPVAERSLTDIPTRYTDPESSPIVGPSSPTRRPLWVNAPATERSPTNSPAARPARRNPPVVRPARRNLPVSPSSSRGLPAVDGTDDGAERAGYSEAEATGGPRYAVSENPATIGWPMWSPPSSDDEIEIDFDSLAQELPPGVRPYSVMTIPIIDGVPLMHVRTTTEPRTRRLY